MCILFPQSNFKISKMTHKDILKMDWRNEAQWAKHFLCRYEDLGSDSQIPGEAGCDSKHLESQCSSAEMEGRNQRSTKGASSLPSIATRNKRPSQERRRARTNH